MPVSRACCVPRSAKAPHSAILVWSSDRMDWALLTIVLVLYLVAAGAFVAYLATARERLRTLAPVVLASAAALPALEIAGRSFAVGHIAVASCEEGLSFLAFSLAILYLLVDRASALAVLGAVITPLVAVLMGMSLVVSSGATALPPEPLSAGLPVHVPRGALVQVLCALGSPATL